MLTFGYYRQMVTADVAAIHRQTVAMSLAVIKRYVCSTVAMSVQCHLLIISLDNRPNCLICHNFLAQIH